MWKYWLLPFLFFATCGVAYAEPSHRIKVYISADMEGIGGVTSENKQFSPKALDYEKFRRLMTL